ncbi:MAG: hypothetical protein MR003_00510, partial [Ruminococcus sp.]
LKGYQAAVGKPVIQPRRPNSRLDKVRHMFQKTILIASHNSEDISALCDSACEMEKGVISEIR